MASSPPDGQAGPDEAADDRVAGGGRHADVPGEVVPHDRGEQGGEHHGHPGVVALDGLGHRVGHGGADDEEGREVEEGGERRGPLGRERPGGHDGGHRVGGVVEAVGEVEDEGQRHKSDDGHEQDVHLRVPLDVSTRWSQRARPGVSTAFR